MIIIRSPLCAFIKKNADTQRAFYRTSYKVKIKTSYNIALRITALHRPFGNSPQIIAEYVGNILPTLPKRCAVQAFRACVMSENAGK